ncbi:GNAT family N-acetyltransferase [Paenibacillus sp. N3.4]|nr:GNAT family N-acetyltransferase [Paenibacillus sp. N3.4]
MNLQRLDSQDKKEVISLYRAVKKDLQSHNINQWDWMYPNGFVIAKDLKQQHMYGIKKGGRVIAAVVVDANQSPEYAALQWSEYQGKAACIHRLAVHPEFQGQGMGKQLLQFAENLARKMGSTSIRLDVYTGNPGAVNMYERAGYQEVGEVRFPFRKVPFLCFEKPLDT